VRGLRVLGLDLFPDLGHQFDLGSSAQFSPF
jgi:hypothetical protein